MMEVKDACSVSLMGVKEACSVSLMEVKEACSVSLMEVKETCSVSLMGVKEACSVSLTCDVLIFFMFVVESIIGVEVLLDGASGFSTLKTFFDMAPCEPSAVMSNLAPMSVMAEIV